MGHHLLERFQVTSVTEAHSDVCEAWIIQHVYGDGNQAAISHHVGFDTESKPWFPSPSNEEEPPPPPHTALIQLAIGRDVLLYRVHDSPVCDTWPPALVRLLQDDTVYKYCVDTRGDLSQLCRAGIIHPKGFVDVQQVASDKIHGGTRESMKRLAERLLSGLQMEKSKSMSVSDWSHVPLSLKQMSYAACDAVISLGIAEALGLAPDTGLVEMGQWKSAWPDRPIDFTKTRTQLVTSELKQLLVRRADQTKMPVFEQLDALVQAPTLRRLFATADDILTVANQHTRLFVRRADDGTWQVCTTVAPPAWLKRQRQPFCVSESDLADLNARAVAEQTADCIAVDSILRKHKSYWHYWLCRSGKIGKTWFYTGDVHPTRPRVDVEGHRHHFLPLALRS
jgi:hypothetical protein